MAFGHFSLGLSQFHGHSTWLVCEAALGRPCDMNIEILALFAREMDEARRDKRFKAPFRPCGEVILWGMTTIC
jgi:hypothetical protein